MPLDDVERLAAEGHLTLFKRRRSVRDDLAENELVVLVINMDDELSKELIPDTGKLGGLVDKWSEKPYRLFLFKDQVAFDQYRRGTVNDLIKDALTVKTVDALPRCCDTKAATRSCT